jgi:uncharacterized protein YdhG (YjbR/CyaY superfamily)
VVNLKEKSGDRSKFFPLIEKKHGLPMSYWFDQMKKVAGKKYPEQIGFLKENYGFSQAHANALVMYSRGSKSSKRFETLNQYLENAKPVQVKTVKKIFKVLQTKYPKLELVIAWNQPMLKKGDEYLLGVSVLKNHILLGPWRTHNIKRLKNELSEFKVNKKTIQIPNDWKVNPKLLVELIKDK